MEELRRMADQGHAKAQFELGFRYAHGYGVSRDDQETAKWYQAGCGARGRTAHDFS